MVDNLVVNQVELDGVVGLDDWVRVTDGSSVVGKEVRNSLLSERVGLDLQELEGSLLGGDSVDGESSLDVVKETEVLSGPLNSDDVHETGGEGLVGPDLSVDLDGPLGHDGGDLTTGQGVLETVSEEDGERKGLSELVRTGRGSGSLQVSRVSNIRLTKATATSFTFVNSRKFPTTCQASMRKEPPIA